jgi:hypothetical protein
MGEAIIGRYAPKDKLFSTWAATWISRPGTRWLLSQQLYDIRQRFGPAEALEYRNYLLWLGCYPGRPLKSEFALNAPVWFRGLYAKEFSVRGNVKQISEWKGRKQYGIRLENGNYVWGYSEQLVPRKAGT